MKNSFRQLILAFTLILASSGAQADVLVLIHGWAANTNTWIQSGVVSVLEQGNWRYAGIVTASQNPVTIISPRQTDADNKLYLAHLQAEAPLVIQAGQLLAELNYIKQLHPGQKLILAGHSAGGVVARLAMVHQSAPKIDKLITIAAPNLGTPRALDGLEVVDGKPFFCPGPGIDFVKSVFGGNDYDYLKASRPALIDLVPARAGSLIAWLNQQPHPESDYHTIIHMINRQGDDIVPAYSQDLNQVSALKGQAKLHVLASGHSLSPADGNLLLSILN